MYRNVCGLLLRKCLIYLGFSICSSWKIEWVVSNWDLNGVGLVVCGIEWRSWINCFQVSLMLTEEFGKNG